MFALQHRNSGALVLTGTRRASDNIYSFPDFNQDGTVTRLEFLGGHASAAACAIPLQLTPTPPLHYKVFEMFKIPINPRKNLIGSWAALGVPDERGFFELMCRDSATAIPYASCAVYGFLQV